MRHNLLSFMSFLLINIYEFLTFALNFKQINFLKYTININRNLTKTDYRNIHFLEFRNLSVFITITNVKKERMHITYSIINIWHNCCL